MDQSEFALHKTVAQFLRLSVHDTVLWWHTPNGGARSVREGARLKAMGTRPGVPDLAFMLDGGRVVWIELKAGKGRLSDSQRDFFAKATSSGSEVAVCASLSEVIAALDRWGVKLAARM